MELATVNIKLSGQTQNVVQKHNVTPAQLALYAFMHGEDCVQSLTVTSIKKNVNPRDELNRLRVEFTSEHSQKCLNTLYPGAYPQLPVTFRSIGYDPEYLAEEGAPVIVAPLPTGAAASIKEKIKAADELRRAEAGQPGTVAPVSTQDMTDALDDTGAEDDDDGFEMSDDPLDAELNRMNTPPPPPPAGD